MTEMSGLAPVGARIRNAFDGQLGTIVGIKQEGDTLTAVVELDSALPLSMSLREIKAWVDPTPCSEPGCQGWATAEATKTALVLQRPHGDARRLDIAWTPFCPNHLPKVGNTWTAIHGIGEDELEAPEQA